MRPPDRRAVHQRGPGPQRVARHRRAAHLCGLRPPGRVAPPRLFHVVHRAVHQRGPRPPDRVARETKR